MKIEHQLIIQKQTEILKTLGQPTRLRILELLRQGERCVCNIYPFVDQEQANVSKHLNMMKRRGILDSRQEGLRVIYWIKTPQVLSIIDQSRIIVDAEVAEYQKAIKGTPRKIPANFMG